MTGAKTGGPLLPRFAHAPLRVFLISFLFASVALSGSFATASGRRAGDGWEDRWIEVARLAACARRGEEVQEALVAAIGDEDPDVSAAALLALAERGAVDGATLDALWKGLRPHHPDHIEAAALLLARATESQAAVLARRLTGELRGEAGRARAAVALLTLLGRGHPAPVVRYLGEAISQHSGRKEWRTRLRSASVLGRIGPSAAGAAEVIVGILTGNDRTDVKRECAFALGRFGDRRSSVISALESALTDPSGLVQEGAVEALRELEPEGLPPLMRRLKTAEGDSLLTIVQALARSTTTPAVLVPAALGLLDAEDPGLREIGARLIGGAVAIGSDEIRHLSAYLLDPEPRVRVVAAVAILRHVPTDTAAAAMLWSTAVSRNPRSARMAVRGLQWLASVRPGPVVGLLTRRLAATDDREERLFSLRMLREIGPGASAAIPALTEVLKTGSHGDRIEALRVLGAIGATTPEAREEMTRLASAGSAELTAEALQALVACGDRSERTLAILRQSLVAKDSAVRAAAAEAALSLQAPLPPGLRPEAGAMSDEDPTVRIACAYLAFHCGRNPARALKVIASALSAEAPTDRAHAARVLGTAGPTARGFLRELLRLLKDKDETVRRQASRAIAPVVGR